MQLFPASFITISIFKYIMFCCADRRSDSSSNQRLPFICSINDYYYGGWSPGLGRAEWMELLWWWWKRSETQKTDTCLRRKSGSSEVINRFFRFSENLLLNSFCSIWNGFLCLAVTFASGCHSTALQIWHHKERWGWVNLLILN